MSKNTGTKNPNDKRKKIVDLSLGNDIVSVVNINVDSSILV